MRQNEFDNMCNSERGWSFERVPDSFLDGHDHSRKESVESRGECARLCLAEEDFDCRSAEYDYGEKTCTLSREDRRTQPEAFKPGARQGVDYIENQCAKGKLKGNFEVQLQFWWVSFYFWLSLYYPLSLCHAIAFIFQSREITTIRSFPTSVSIPTFLLH